MNGKSLRTNDLHACFVILALALSVTQSTMETDICMYVCLIHLIIPTNLFHPQNSTAFEPTVPGRLKVSLVGVQQKGLSQD